MADVFLSYSRRDTARAIQIKDGLEGLGLTVFFDTEGLDGGDVFPDVLDHEVKTAAIVVGVWSQHSLTRPWVKIECDIGRERGVLAPVQIEEIPKLEVPAAFWNVQVDDLSDFTGDTSHPGWLRFVRSIAKQLNRPDLMAKEIERQSATSAADAEPGSPVRKELEALRAELRAMRAAKAAPSASMSQSQSQGGGKGWMIAAGVLALIVAGGAGAWFGGLIPRGGSPAEIATVPDAPQPEPTPPVEETWAVQGRAELGSLWIYGVAFSPDSARFVAAGTDDIAHVIDAATVSEILALKGHTDDVTSAAYSPDGARIATSSSDSTVRVWDAATGASLRTIEPGTDGARYVNWSPDGATLIVAADDRALMFDAATGDPKGALTTGQDVFDAVFSPDGKLVATAEGDGVVRIWDLATLQPVLQLWGHSAEALAAAFSPDGKLVATGSVDGTARIFSLEGGKELLKLEGHEASVMAIAFSPDGRSLATSSHDATIRIWDVATGVLKATLEAHDGQIFDIAWSPDAARIASGGWDGMAYVWGRR